MQKPIVLQAKKGARYTDAERVPVDFPPVECADCGHVMILRKYPDRRRSRLRCGMCGVVLIWIPTEAESLAAARRAKDSAKDSGPMYGEG